MTRDEILRMDAGHEMDLLVAIRLERPTFKVPEYRYSPIRPVDWSSPGGLWTLDGYANWLSKSPYPVPLPLSVDIAASFRVVDRLDKYEFYLEHSRKEWFALFVNVNVPGDWRAIKLDNNATAPTASLAICRAALLTTLEAEDDQL